MTNAHEHKFEHTNLGNPRSLVPVCECGELGEGWEKTKDPDFGTVRARAFRAVEDHPEHVDAIAHNLSAALMKLNIPAMTWQATMDELNRRWEFRIRRTEIKRKETT